MIYSIRFMASDAIETFKAEHANLKVYFSGISRCRWPSGGLRQGSMAASLLGFRVRIPPRQECLLWALCVLSGRGLCDGPITRPEQSYRLWRVTECDLETSRIRQPWPALGCCSLVHSAKADINSREKKKKFLCQQRGTKKVCTRKPN